MTKKIVIALILTLSLSCLNSFAEDVIPNYNEMGVNYTNSKEYDKAIECFTKAISDVQRSAYLYYNRGIAVWNNIFCKRI